MSFYAVAASLISLVGDYLLQEKVTVERSTVSALAVSIAETYQTQSTDACYGALVEAGRQTGGRLLLLDMDGKVMLDTFNEFNGMRLDLGEVSTILSGEMSADYGFHRLANAEHRHASSLWAFLSGADSQDVWVGYFTAALVRDGQRLGVLLYSSQIQDMVDSLNHLRAQMLMYFMLATAIVFIFSLIVSRWLTRPVAALTAGVEQISRGDFKSRVHVAGRGEMAQLKTPLATMKILLESLIYQDDMEPALRKEFMQDIDREIDRLNSVIGDLLTLVHIDSRKMTLHREPMLLSDAVKETVRRLLPLANGRGQEIEVKISDACEIYADSLKIQQVIYNIIENGIKYTPDGGRISVHLFREGRDAVLQISDTGVGIPPEDVPHIFDRFYRVDKARSRDTGGTGLGLSIVQQIVRLHAGSIDVHSELGVGTTFTVELPMK